MKLVIINNKFFLKKSVSEGKTLEYFKKELLKVLERQSLNKSLIFAIDDIMQNGKVATVGEVRVWNGEKYRKVAPGKWRKVYESHTRGAKQSVAILTKKIQNAKSTDELLQLVMENTNRFLDSKGNLLPIVEELKKAVNESKTRLNQGKSTTREIIESRKKPINPVEDVSSQIKGFDDLVKNHYDKSFESDEEELADAMKILDSMNNAKKKLDEIRTKYRKDEIDMTGAEYEEFMNLYPFLDSRMSRHKRNVERLQKEIENNKVAKEVEKTNIDNLSENDWAEIREVENTIKEFVENTVNEDDFWGRNEKINNLFNANINIKGFKRWLKINNGKNVDDFAEIIRNKLNDKLREKKEEEAIQKNKAIAEKLKQIESQERKKFSDKEIKESFKALDVLEKKKETLIQRIKDNKKAYDNADKDVKNREKELYAQGFNAFSNEVRNDKELNSLAEKRRNLWQEERNIREEIPEIEKELDKHMEAVVHYYLNEFRYEKDSNIENCKDTNDVMELMKSKDWYSDTGKEKLDIKSLDVEAAKDVFKCMEKMFAIFPEQKGQDLSVSTNYSTSSTWAWGASTHGIIFNSKYWNKYNTLKEDYEKTEGSFHPKGTTAKDIIYHEYYHVMTSGNGNLASMIKDRVTKTLKTKGKKGGPKQKDLIKEGVSEYALKNADEFGAECFCQAVGSDNPSQFAIEVFKETLKFKKYMRGLV